MQKYDWKNDSKIKETVKNYLRENKTYTEIASLLNTTYCTIERAVMHYNLREGIPVPEKPGKIDRAEIYGNVFEIINETFEKYTCGIKPVKCLSNYTNNKKVEIANLVISDTHFGKKNKIYYPPLQKEIETYNDEIRKRMMQRYLDSVAEIVAMQQHCYYWEKLNLFLLGDLIEGDGYVFAGQEFSITKVAGSQLWDAVRDFIFMINELSKLFPYIEVVGLVGNHSMNTSNRKTDMPVENYLEYHVYRAIQLWFVATKNKRVKIIIPTSRDYSVKVYNHLFCMTHGDDFGGGANATRIRKAKDIYINLPEEKFDVFIHAHFHSLEKSNIGDRGILLSNGAWIPFDSFAKKLFGMYTEPKQWFFSTNEKRSMTLTFELDFKGTLLSNGFRL